jgi:inner membrane protein
MDNPTHTLVGLMMSRCGLGKVLPGNSGPILLMLAANTPDIDGIPGLGNAMRYLSEHRGYPHSILLAPLIALLPLAVVCAVAKIRPTWQAWLASIAGVLSHLLLDWTNIYGTRLLMPLNAKWYHLDITDVVDPWIWIILLIALGAPALAGLVGSEIASKKTTGPKQAWAWIAIFLLLAYEGARFLAHDRALEVMQAHLYGTETTPKFNALPRGYFPLTWKGVVVMPEAVLIVPVDLTLEYNPADGRVEFPTLSSPSIDAAKTSPAFQVFTDFDQLPFWRVKPEGDLIRVDLLDLRFGTPQRPSFMATALVTPNGHVEESQVRMGVPQFGTKTSR